MTLFFESLEIFCLAFKTAKLRYAIRETAADLKA
jgi:hypothetical protein